MTIINTATGFYYKCASRDKRAYVQLGIYIISSQLYSVAVSVRCMLVKH